MKIPLFIVLLLFSKVCYASPSITTCTPITHGGACTIIGASFSTDVSATGNLVWDNLEDGSGDINATIGTWSTAQNMTIVSTGNRSTNSNYLVQHDFTGTYTVGSAVPTSVKSSTLFVQYWFKIDSNWDWGNTVIGAGNQFLSNIKWWRTTGGTGGNEDALVQCAGYASASGQVIYGMENIAPDGHWGAYTWDSYKTDITKGIWHLFQFAYKEGDYRTGNGIIKVWLDGVEKINDTDLVTKYDFDVLKSIALVGWYNSWGTDAGSNLPDTFYMDDMYASPSWSRVEIGNNPVYSSCTHREIQIPTAWSDTSITVTINQGSFNNGEQAYLFVVDSDGNASEGFPITFAGTSLNITGTLQATGSITYE